MKALILLVGLLVTTNVFAENLAYDCEVRDFTNPDAFTDTTLTLDGASGKVKDSIALGSGKNSVQVELYFDNIQIHLSNESGNNIFSTTAPDSTPIIKTSLINLARVVCKRK
jgi:hypothetical protein